jgi:hypothetical protein
LLAHGRWFSPGIPVSATTKTGRHDIAEILLKSPFSSIFRVYFLNIISVQLKVSTLKAFA